MDEYHHPVFFECRTLQPDEERKVRTYFQIKRKSGGGACGPLTLMEDNIYKIAFRRQEDQQAVLQKSQHAVKLADEQLVFSVWKNMEPHDSTSDNPPAGGSTTPTTPPPLESEEPPNPASTLPSCGKERQPDSNLERHGWVECEEHPLMPVDCPLLPNPEEETLSSQATAGAPVGSVHVEVIKGTLESQEVDVLVSPMVGLDPLSTCFGNTLLNIAGPQLINEFWEAAVPEVAMGGGVLVERVPGLPSDAVFFLSLARWNEDPNGTPVEVLRMGIQEILTCCETRGFRSVALPVLGVGRALGFPPDEAAKVLFEEILAFEQERASRSPLAVRIVIHNDNPTEVLHPDPAGLNSRDREAVYQQDPSQVPQTTRMVLVGKTGWGKSSLANTLIGAPLFRINSSPRSETQECQSETRCVNGRSIMVIDTPGFFDTRRSEDELKPEIVSCITACSPGPHAFLVVLRVEKFTEQEQEAVARIAKYFSDDALKHAVVVFTHGNQVPEGTTIQDFVAQDENLSELVRKCGNRCHVFDNRYWNEERNGYRSNQFQREQLLETIDKMVTDNNGECYTNEMLQTIEVEIRQEEVEIQLSSPNLPPERVRSAATAEVSRRLRFKLAGMVTGALLGALFGVEQMVGSVLSFLKTNAANIHFLRTVPNLLRIPVPAAAGSTVLTAAGVVAAVVTAGTAVAGGVVGGGIGADAAEDAETLGDAVRRAAKAVFKKRETGFLQQENFS